MSNGVAGAVVALSALAFGTVASHADAGVSFSADYVNKDLGGGEPYVIYSHGGNDLIYTSHEGTTHLDNSNPHTGDCDLQTHMGFLCSYDNQVNIWYSQDGGQNWTKSLGNPFYTGFSDPSLSEDEGGNVYDTGIDLANDAVYASQDGGNTWIAGTPQCHAGDRPWLAGGRAGEVFMSTDTEEAGHEIFHGTLSGSGGQNLTLVCSAFGIPDGGGQGQLYYDHANGDLIEGADFSDGGFGVGVLPNASGANFSGVGTATPFTQHESATLCTAHPSYCSDFAIFAPQIAIDRGNTTYVVWANNPRGTGTTGCSTTVPNAIGGPNLLPNQVIMISTPDDGKTWSQPIVIASPPNANVVWPWVTAGAAGNVSVVWDQSDQITDPDCDSAQLLGGSPTNWTVQAANIYGLNTTNPVVDQVNAVPNFDGLHAGGIIHVGGICQSGTTCAVTGQDRRLGDFLTNSLDQNGCVMVATGDTALTNPNPPGGQFPTSRPLFLRQASGPSLTTGLPCASPIASTPEAPYLPAFLGAGVVGTLIVGYRRRRSRTA